MQIKRFEARDMQEAMRQVKEALGPEAIILSTKTVKKPGDRFRPARPPVVEVVAATDVPAAEPPKAAGKAVAALPKLPAKKSPAPGTGDPFIRRFSPAGFRRSSWTVWPRRSKALGQGRREGRTAESCRSYLRWKLMEAVEVASPDLTGSQIWAFVGPTGVGKTTTLAKLAAHFSLRLAKKVTLITIDTYRIGAVDQLKTYARILRLPLEIAAGPEELREALRRSGIGTWSWSTRPEGTPTIPASWRNSGIS